MLDQVLLYLSQEAVSLRLVLISITVFSFSLVSAQCDCPYDMNGDCLVTIGSGEILIILSTYGLEPDPDSGPSYQNSPDFNENGYVDIRDLMDYLGHLGNSGSCDEIIDASDHIGDLVLQEFYIHESPLNATDTIPSGAITYRLYAEVEHEEDIITTIYGDDESPMWISTPGSFYHTTVDGTYLGGPTVSGINSAFLGIFPTLMYDSWLTLDFAPEVDGGSGTVSGIGIEPFWYDTFQQGDDILINDSVGGGVFMANYWEPGDMTYDNLRLLGQFTVMGSTEISGQLSMQIIHAEGPTSYGFATRSFNLSNLGAFGCTNPEAENYDPGALYDDGSCFMFGDLNGDGDIDIEDLLDFLSDFPCAEDCGESDLNGDGVVNIFDLLILLGLI